MKIWLVNLSAEKASVPVIYSALPGWWVLRLWRVCVLSLFPAMTEVEKHTICLVSFSHKLQMTSKTKMFRVYR